jgi:hypothetical protein
MNIYKSKENRKANNVGLFCNARDEKNIKEWAAHHLLIGFDFIVIFDHKSKVSLLKEFENFDKRVIIIKANLPDGNIKQQLMNEAKEYAKKLNLDWFIYLDADEFLILNNIFKGVKHFLNTYSYGDSIAVNWLMFGSNNYIQDPSGLILENYKLSCRKLDKHVKSFVRTSKVKYSDNPHYYHMKDPSKMIGLDFKILNYPYCFKNNNIPYYRSPAYIAHYVYQSEESYIKRKIDLIGDNGIKRNNMGDEIHKLYNECLNVQPQKYINQIKELLKYYSIK